MEEEGGVVQDVGQGDFLVPAASPVSGSLLVVSVSDTETETVTEPEVVGVVLETMTRSLMVYLLPVAVV